jgi:hypothetical protein
MAALHLISIGASFPSQGVDKLGKAHAVIAALHAHIATDAGPDCLILLVTTIQSEPSLYYQTRIKLRLALSNRTDGCAFATVETQACLGIPCFSFYIEYSGYTGH